MPFAIALSETEIQEARGVSRGNAFRGSNNVIPLSLRFGLRSMDFFADRRERAPSKRGNAFRGSSNVIPLSLRFGLRSMDFFADRRERAPSKRGNAFRGSSNVISLSLRFGLRSMYFLTDFFADCCERAASKLVRGGCFSVHFRHVNCPPLPAALHRRRLLPVGG